MNNKNRGKYSWKRTKVDVEKHCFAPDLDPDMESPDRFVEDYMSDLSSTPVDPTKPLWEIHILNVKTSDANAVIVYKIHHSIGDGVSLTAIVMACARKTADPEALPVICTRKRNPGRKIGLFMRLFVLIWTMFLIVYNTLVDCVVFLATITFLRDSETPITVARGVQVSPKRFVHRTVDLDDVKLVKNAMNVVCTFYFCNFFLVKLIFGNYV